MNKGEVFIIKSIKGDGSLHRKWHVNTFLKRDEKAIIAVNEKTNVTEKDGSEWITRYPAVLYFPTEAWFNVAAQFKPDGIHFYCNLSSPYTIKNNVLTYIDYDLDILVTPKRKIYLLDEEEYEEHRKTYNYSKEVDEKITETIANIYHLIEKEQDPFTEKFARYWYNIKTVK